MCSRLASLVHKIINKKKTLIDVFVVRGPHRFMTIYTYLLIALHTT